MDASFNTHSLWFSNLFNLHVTIVVRVPDERVSDLHSIDRHPNRLLLSLQWLLFHQRMLLKHSLGTRFIQFFAFYLVHVMAELQLLRTAFSGFVDKYLAISTVVDSPSWMVDNSKSCREMGVVECEKLSLAVVEWSVHQWSLVIATSLDISKRTMVTVFDIGDFRLGKLRVGIAGNCVALEKCYPTVSSWVLQQLVLRKLQSTKTTFLHAIFLGDKSAKVIEPRQISYRRNWFCQNTSKKIELSVFLQKKQRGSLQAPYADRSILESIDLRLLKYVQKYCNTSHFVRSSILYRAECLPVQIDVNIGNCRCRRGPPEIFYIFVSYGANSRIVYLVCSVFLLSFYRWTRIHYYFSHKNEVP